MVKGGAYNTAGRRQPTAHASSAVNIPFGRPGNATDAWPHREQCATRWYSKYRRFWSGAGWRLFLLPAAGGFAEARQHKSCAAGTSTLEKRPAVYEFAITSSRGSKRFKVYVGETNNMWRRHHLEYQAHGDHLLPFLDAAVRDGCAVWCRQRYLGSKQEAAAAELQWLSAYNYAWNARCNQRSRHVQLQPAWCGLQVAAVQVPPPWQPAAAAAQRRPRRNSKAQQQPMQPQLLHYQHQPQPPPPQPLQYQQQAAASTLMQMQAGACGPLGSAQQQHGWSASTPVDRCSSAAMEWQAGGQPALAMPWPPQQAADRRGQGAPAMQQQQQQQVYHVRQQQQQQQQQVVPQQQGDRVWQPPLQASHDALMPYGVVWHK